MTEQPVIVERAEVAYVGLPATTTMADLARAIDEGYGRLFGWLAAHGVEPAAAPFIRYRRIDMARLLDIELGVPVAASTPAPASDDPIHLDHLPAGRYATAIHTGHYDGLVAANAALQDWAADNGVT